MDYTQEIITSSLWIARTLALTVIFFVLIVTLTLFSVRLSLVHSTWYNNMYTALQEFNQTVFWEQMILFCFIAGFSVAAALISYYLNQRFSINWIEWLNTELLEKWMDKRAYYKSQYMGNNLDNPDQRIQQDIQSYVKTTLSLSTGVIDAVTSMISYTILLWGLAGPMSLLGIEIPRAMVYLVFAYVIFTTLIAFWLGKPLIRLNFANEKLNANYRYSLIRVKEYAESIAFYAGEKVEKSRLYKQFRAVIDNMWDIVFRALKFSGFNLVVSQISVVFPLLIQVGRYFEKQIKLGDLMQTLQVFGKLHSNLSFFRNTYDSFAEYKATLDRLTGFHYSVEAAQKQSKTDITDHPTDVIFQHLSVKSPMGKILIKDLNLTLTQGNSLLIQGQSGVGKTTLLRTIAGLWSYAEGKIFCPQHNTLFLSQRPYLPQGNLLTALYYPDTTENVDLAKITRILERVQLAHLQDRLEQEQDWSRILSLGEQQRLAFARLLLHKPKVAFLDEASASLDEGMEHAMYRLIREELPNTTIISGGHRSTLVPLHQQQLELHTDGSWVFNPH